MAEPRESSSAGQGPGRAGGAPTPAQAVTWPPGTPPLPGADLLLAPAAGPRGGGAQVGGPGWVGWRRWPSCKSGRPAAPSCDSSSLMRRVETLLQPAAPPLWESAGAVAGLGVLGLASDARLVAVEGRDVEHVAVRAHPDGLHLPVARQRRRVRGAAGAEDLKLEGWAVGAASQGPQQPRTLCLASPDLGPAEALPTPVSLSPGRAAVAGLCRSPVCHRDLQKNLVQVTVPGGQAHGGGSSPTQTLFPCTSPALKWPGATPLGPGGLGASSPHPGPGQSRAQGSGTSARRPQRPCQGHLSWLPDPVHSPPGRLTASAPGAAGTTSGHPGCSPSRSCGSGASGG